MTILLFQDHNSRYSIDLIANSLRFLEGIQENERQVELVKLSGHPCRLVVVDGSFKQSLQNASRNLSKEGFKIKFESMLAENIKNVQVAPTTGIGKATEVVNCAMKKVNHALYRGEVFRKSEKSKPFIKVITLKTLLKLNLLLQFLICKVNDFDLKQYLFLAQYAYMYLRNMENYLQILVAVSSIQDEIITQLPQLKAILGNKSCAVSNSFCV